MNLISCILNFYDYCLVRFEKDLTEYFWQCYVKNEK